MAEDEKNNIQDEPKSDNAARETPPIPEEEHFELGVSINMPFGSQFRDSWELFRTEDISLAQLSNMRKTNGQARALYRILTIPIRAALKTATFLPENITEGGDEESQFIEQMFTLPVTAGGMETPFRSVIAEMLTALFDGFSTFEQVYHSPKKGPLKGKWTLQKLASRPSDTITFLLDKNGNFDGLRQRASFVQRGLIDIKISADNSFYFTCQAEERKFYGQSMFLSAFYHFDKAVKLEAIAHLAAQRAAVGTRVGKVPQNAGKNTKVSFKRALADLGFAQHIVLPPGYEVEILHDSSNFNFIDLINYHNSQMSKSILCSFFDEHQGGSDTAFVDFGQQTDAYFLMMLNTIMGDIEDAINTQIIPKFIDWNFDSGKYPNFRFGQLTAEQKEALRETFGKLATAGQSLTISPQFLLEIEKQMAEEFGLELDYEQIEKEQEELRAQRQALAEAQQHAVEAKASFDEGRGQQTGIASGEPTKPGGKPGPNEDSTRQTKPQNPAAAKPTGKKMAGLSNSDEVLMTKAIELLQAIDEENLEESQDE